MNREVTGRQRPRPGAPEPSDVKAMRVRSRRTQAQAAQLLDVSERQFQRWEAGEQEMPSAAWRLFTLTCGYRYPVDFETAEEPTRGWDSLHDGGRDTIERGDRVVLQPFDGPKIEARVWLDRVHDGLVDEHSYGAVVIGFPDHPAAGMECSGYFIGERITFSKNNAFHVEQRAPSQASSV